MRQRGHRNEEAPGTPDPWMVLGLTEDATAAEIQAAWLRLVRAHPPDRDPEHFERIRDAYERIRDPLVRARRALEEPVLGDTLEDWLVEEGRRRFVGLSPWLDALREG